ncbi:CaiB/BaiF CoA transferase family protein [Solimonas flava]|uniref:CaiB/BaiF CoA transferase family protein n=1 Tax=Solimonas flava TaxID=415849 RepID=UPI00040FD4E6|nr:CoA transferase [Solimonas flava]
MSAATPPASGPLAGYRVLELCSTIAGPACTRLFADFGAEVIKVEPPEGDSVRQIGLPDEGIALFAASILRNKRAVTIDLKTARGRELVLRLAAGCDLVVENFRPGTLERLGLGYEALSAQNPGLVLVRISGYGQSGPRREMPGYGAICEAFGGIRHLIGDPDRPPPRVAVPVVDYLTAAYAAYGATLALLERQRSGRGQVVDCALYEAAFSMLEASVPAYDRFGYVPNREGSRLPYMAPNNLYPTRDGGYVLIAANNDATFRRLMQAIGRAALLDDPRYATINSRWEHVDALDAEIGAWTAARDAAEIGAQLDAAGVPCSRVCTLADAAHDPHYAAREMLLRAPHAHFGELLQVGIVPKLSATPGAVRWSGPELSADTRAVLAERLGLSDAELDALEAEAVIRSRGATP